MNQNEMKKCILSREKCSFDIKESYETLSPSQKNELLIYLFKHKWWNISVLIVSLGIALIFLGAILSIFIDPSLKNDLKIFESIQAWVGVVLGIIATLFSIISMYLSFYNLEQQKESEKNVINLNNNLQKNIVKEVNELLKIELLNLGKELSKIHEKIEEIPTFKANSSENKRTDNSYEFIYKKER